ncbi:hypothetical protein ACIQGZ_15565 [Streptomyces sp. NPDC092296]|uniref:hypothetical protein n=1 Tax=Streptomyces sp. NPDC092296 TaxID=3366012 RepID=UPI00382A10EC
MPHDNLPDAPGYPVVHNTLNDTIVQGASIQAGQVHGGITFNYAAPGPTRPDDAPDQVPAPAAPFVDRTADLSRLDAWLAPGAAPSIGVLTGLPGVGKSATACHWAQRSRADFPDGQLYVDFAALRDRAGADVSEALAMCLRALGMDDQYIPGSLSERAGLYRTRTAGRRVLVVLDDVTQPAQVSALVPKGPGAVLATSNARLGELSLHGARLMPLEPLDAAGGAELLSALCGAERVAAEPDAAALLVELCGGLPVALHIAAARLLTRRRLTLAGLAEELADENHRLTGLTVRSVRGESTVSAVIGLAYRDLPDDAARLYRLLGLLPGRTFDAGTAAAAAGLDTPTAERLLDVLDDAHLLDTTEDGRHRFHDLVRLHARERAAAEEPDREREAVTARVVRHYLALTALADRAVQQKRLRIGNLAELLRDAPDPFAAGGRPAALAWLEAERADILAVLRAAARHGLDRRTWQLAEAFTILFLNHRHLGDWQESLELGIAAAVRDGQPAAEARLRSLLSRPLLDLGQDERARLELETAAARAEESENLVLRASVQEFLGRYWDRHDPDRARAAYRRSLDLNTAADEPRGVAIAAFFLGCAQHAAGDHHAALATLDDAYRRMRELGDARMAARVRAALGQVHGSLGDSGAARRELEAAARELHEVRASHYEAQALVALADLGERTGGDPAAVREQLTRAAEIHQAGGSPEAEALLDRLARLG